MKLIFCPACGDLMRLLGERRACRCGASWGHYVDDVVAEVGGRAALVGIGNASFEQAFRERGNVDRWRTSFSAWFMGPDDLHVVRRS